MPKQGKATRQLQTEKVAQVLVEAFIYGEKQAAKNHGLALRTVQGYRQKLITDKNGLADEFRQKKDLALAGWAEQLPEAILAGMNFLKRAAQEADPKDPAVIHAITGSVKILTELQLFKDFINARYGDKSNELGETPRLVDSIPSRIEE